MIAGFNCFSQQINFPTNISENRKIIRTKKENFNLKGQVKSVTIYNASSYLGGKKIKNHEFFFNEDGRLEKINYYNRNNGKLEIFTELEYNKDIVIAVTKDSKMRFKSKLINIFDEDNNILETENFWETYYNKDTWDIKTQYHYENDKLLETKEYRRGIGFPEYVLSEHINNYQYKDSLNYNLVTYDKILHGNLTDPSRMLITGSVVTEKNEKGDTLSIRSLETIHSSLGRSSNSSSRIQYIYNDLGELKDKVDHRQNYIFDEKGRISETTRQDFFYKHIFTYDEFDRIISIKELNENGVNINMEKLVYDKNGNYTRLLFYKNSEERFIWQIDYEYYD